MTATKTSLKDRLKAFFARIKELQGDPRYVARGMAIGVFIGVTPTIPFHTVIAIFLAYIMRGSKPAAAIGVWFANPATIPFFYIGSFKLGTLILKRPIPFDVKFESITALTDLGLDVTAAMILGGAVLGVPPAIIAYILTHRLMNRVRERAKKKKGSSCRG